MRYATEAECGALATAKANIEEARRLIGEACLELVMADGGELALCVAEKLRDIESTVGYASYNLLTPQPEWLGGSIEENAVRYRWPHGVNK